MDEGDGTYSNPIIHADYSDPDAIRVGKDFFLISSSFNSLPGIPLLHSRDLVNWRIANHVVESLPFPRYDLPAHGRGAWAPSLRFHEGLFYVYFAMPDEGVFMSKTDDPFGKWSPPACVKRTIGWIDPCPFWDDDGNAYLVNAFANSRVGFKSVLRLNRMKPDGAELYGEGKFVFDGQKSHVTMEGPKMYKRNGYYYLFAPAGGVKQGWQTVLRSREVFGPYEDKIVLHQGNTAVNGPHQGAWVELESGESWFLHFQDAGAYGRIIHLQPLRWVFDWPCVGVDVNNDGIGEPVMRFDKPKVEGSHPPCDPASSDDFGGDALGLQWQWQANPRKEWYSLAERKNQLRLFSLPLPDVERANLTDVPHVLSQKFPAPAFRADTTVELGEAVEGDSAGLVVYGDEYRSLGIRRTSKAFEIVLFCGATRCESSGDIDIKAKWDTVESLEIVDACKASFRVTVGEGAKCRLSYSLDGREYRDAGGEFSARPGIWVGAKLGIYCVNGAGARSGGYADFHGFRVSR